MIHLNKVKQLLEIVHIQDVAQQLGVLENMRRTANSWYGTCPFCNAPEPKFYIYPNHRTKKPGWYRCYRASCLAHGDALQLIRDLNQLNFGQAVARLAAYAGISLGKLQTLDRHATTSR